MSAAPDSTAPRNASCGGWRRALVGISLALNALTLAAAGWLTLGGGLMAVAQRFIRAHHEQLESHFESFPLARGDIVFLGDSITEGGRWEELFPALRARNRGIGGDTTAGVLARLAQLSRSAPSAVFVMIGTNDLGSGVPEAEIVANVETILARLRADSPSTRLFVQSVLPRGAEYRARIESLNARLAGVVRAAGAEFVDLYPHFLDPNDGSIRDDYSNDELHLLGPGYRVWQSQLASRLPAATVPSREEP